MSDGFQRGLGGALTGGDYEPLSFGDADEFIDWERQLGWDLESIQLSGGPGGVQFDHFAFPELIVAHYRSAVAMHSAFALPAGGLVFSICRAKLPVQWSGREVPPTVLAVPRAGREHIVTQPAGFDVYEFMTTEELVRRTELFPPAFFSTTERLDSAWLPLPEPQTQRFLRRLDDVFDRARRPAVSIEGALTGTELFDLVLSGLQQVIDAGLAVRNGGTLRRSRRSDLLFDAESLMAAHMMDDLSADEIAQELGVSYRVLSYAFRDAYGVSPGRFFRAMKLNDARRMLRSGEVPVELAAASVGIHSTSRFASQYRRLFGELPSRTRARGRSEVTH